MNTLFLDPTDVLFFRDGRPMSGSLSGHGATWPFPTVTNAALHAELWQAQVNNTLKNDQGELVKVHRHDHHSRAGQTITDIRIFGSLVTAGPFPVKDGVWLFPRPLDAGIPSSTTASLLPLSKDFTRELSNLPKLLPYPVANTRLPTKETPSPWWNAAAWRVYLDSSVSAASLSAFFNDSDFADAESTYGIGIDAATGTQDGERFYSAHYLRLKPHCRLGLLAEAMDKVNGDTTNKRDLIATLFPNNGTQTPVIVGGQQRVCTVERNHDSNLPLPRGKSSGFQQKNPEGNDTWLVKWVLLTPAIFPEIGDHKGGWLPSWIRHSDGQVMLKSGDTQRGEREGREAWRKRVAALPNLSARLVAALVGKPIPVTGYALPHETTGDKGGAKPTHLAVPAGSVYYFECKKETAAEALAAALNWHGAGDLSTIRNRRSTLMGEKGFGLGVCGTWEFHSGSIPTA